MFHHGVAGGVYFGQVRLAWSIPLFGNGFRPIFIGYTKEIEGQTELRASYGMTLFHRLFWTFWYGLLSLMVLILLGIFFSDAPKNGSEWIILVVLPIFVLVPILFHLVLNRNADRHFEAIVDLLEREAGFSVVEKSA